MTAPAITERPVIFLDTTALHFIFSYLEKAKNYSLPPTGTEKTIIEIRGILEQHMPKGIAGNHLNGAKILGYLQRMTDPNGDDAQVYMSRFTRAEILYGNLDGCVHKKMAEAGFSYRMRPRLADMSELALMYLEQEDFDHYRNQLDANFLELSDNGKIRIEISENNPVRFTETARISEFLQSHTFLDVHDCWIYSSAIALQANELITTDKHLKNIANRFKSPQQNTHFLTHSQQLERLTREVLVLPTEVSLKFPAAPAIQNDIPQIWQIPNNPPSSNL